MSSVSIQPFLINVKMLFLKAAFLLVSYEPAVIFSSRPKATNTATMDGGLLVINKSCDVTNMPRSSQPHGFNVTFGGRPSVEQ